MNTPLISVNPGSTVILRKESFGLVCVSQSHTGTIGIFTLSGLVMSEVEGVEGLVCASY